MAPSSSVQSLGMAPHPEAIDQWMRDHLGLHREVVGKTVQGRDIALDELGRGCNDHMEDDLPSILFLSLVHGNEPMGLLALLFASQLLQQTAVRGSHCWEARILFLPILNLDAYTLNRNHGSGCRRTNLRHTCNMSQGELPKVLACPFLSRDGVDLNRNYPMDWEGEYVKRSANRCTHGYKGPAPFSEPETRALRDVIRNYNVRAAMSFHSLSGSGSPPLLIHPYASTRPFDQMDPTQRQRYREWSRAMNPSPSYYKTGTAEEAIQYTAGGTTIDYMQSLNITAFVVEVSPPCENRWCPDMPSRVWKVAKRDGVTARRFVQLVVHGQVSEDATSIVYLAFITALLVVLSWVSYKRRFSIMSVIRRARRKEKHVPAETEMQSLVENL